MKIELLRQNRKAGATLFAMKKITQAMRYRQSLILYAEKHDVTKAAIRYNTNRQQIGVHKQAVQPQIQSSYTLGENPFRARYPLQAHPAFYVPPQRQGGALPPQRPCGILSFSQVLLFRRLCRSARRQTALLQQLSHAPSQWLSPMQTLSRFSSL